MKLSHCCGVIPICAPIRRRIGRATSPNRAPAGNSSCGNSLLQDKITVGLSFEAFGMPMEGLIEEYASLGLKGQVLDKWLYGNAQRFFRLN